MATEPMTLDEFRSWLESKIAHADTTDKQAGRSGAFIDTIDYLDEHKDALTAGLPAPAGDVGAIIDELGSHMKMVSKGSVSHWDVLSKLRAAVTALERERGQLSDERRAISDLVGRSPVMSRPPYCYIEDIIKQRDEAWKKNGSYEAQEQLIDAHLFENADTQATRNFITEDNIDAKRLLRICDLQDAEGREKQAMGLCRELAPHVSDVLVFQGASRPPGEVCQIWECPTCETEYTDPEGDHCTNPRCPAVRARAVTDDEDEYTRARHGEKVTPPDEEAPDGSD